MAILGTSRSSLNNTGRYTAQYESPSLILEVDRTSLPWPCQVIEKWNAKPGLAAAPMIRRSSETEEKEVKFYLFSAPNGDHLPC
jgi:hypothetical protein